MRELNKATWIFFDTGYLLMDESATDRAWATAISQLMVDGGFARLTPKLMLEALDSAVIHGHLEPKRGALEILGISNASFYRSVALRGWPVLDEPYPDAAETLKRLSRAGYRLGLIADETRAEQRAKLEWSGLLDAFEVALFPGDAEFTKPNPELFRLALTMAGCKPRKALMVGDRLDFDMEPAKQLGMGTVWVRRGLFARTFPVSEEAEPDLMLPTLSALADQLTNSKPES